MKVHQVLAAQLARLGVRHVFTLMSEETAKLTEELSGHGVLVLHTRHEHVAVGMADGYSRVTSGVGVAIVGRGPGLTNAVNALTAAAKGGSRVLVLAGDSATVVSPPAARRPANKKYIDQSGLLTALGVRHVGLASPAAAPADVVSAFERVRDGGGLLVVNMPAPLLEAECPAAPADAAAPPRPAELNRDDLAAVADVLEEGWAARRPVILAGRGAVHSGARDALVRLGDRIGALLGTTVQAKGYFAGHPFDVGVVGTFSAPEASQLLVAADVVLAFGASLNEDTTYRGTIFGRARIIQIDAEPSALSRYEPVDVGAVADAATAADAIVAELDRRGHTAPGFRTPERAEALGRGRAEVAVPDRGGPDGMDPRSLWITLDSMLPAERTLAVDGGNFQEWVVAHMSVPDATAFLWPIDYGAIGCGLGPAMGAAVGRPDRRTVFATGDGGLMMALADLDTAVRYGLDILVVVNNNRALGSELHFLRAHGYSGVGARYDNPLFEEVARGLGLEATTVNSLSELDDLRKWLGTTHGPRLLDCRIHPDIVSDSKQRAGM